MMRKFLIYAVLFIAICCLSFYTVICYADGTTDAIYLKFTSPKQHSLIVGSSRTAQGIQPAIINNVIPGKQLYNYGFSIVNSPYGEAYYNSIKKKLDPKSVNGIFLVCVSPWVISVTTKNVMDSLHFRELNSFMDKTKNVSQSPNIEYFINSFNGKYVDIFINKKRKGEYQTFFVHDDGWLEVTIESDLVSKSVRTANKLASYREKRKGYTGMSEIRLNYLKKTIQLLKNHGEVYVVRIPVCKEMLDIENELIPEFDGIIEELSMQLNVKYLNFMPMQNKYSYTDGNHLDLESSKAFSLYLAKQIKNSIKAK